MANRRSTPAVILSILVAPLACLGVAGQRGADGSPPPLFYNLGTHQRKVSTTSAKAREYLDQGLTLAFAFNHDEADLINARFQAAWRRADVRIHSSCLCVKGK